MPPLKPEVCIIGGRLAVFLGADYKFLDVDTADALVRTMQRELAKLRRERGAQPVARKATPPGMAA